MKCHVCGVETETEHSVCAACESAATAVTAGQGARLRRLPYFAPGDLVGERFTIVEAVGEGGMGRVFKAIDRKVGRTVALKLIKPVPGHEDQIPRFLQELALARDVTHPNVGRVYDLGEVSECPYISMEFVNGQSLRELVRSLGRLSPKQTVAIARQICAGLGAIHDRSIVHRDLKPANIMIDRSGKVSLMDFGVAYHRGDDTLEDVGKIVGTVGYQAPEQVRGDEADARSDIYSLGIVLFEMLTGRRPPGDGDEVPLAMREKAVCPPPSSLAPEVPKRLDAIVLRCLAPEPAARFQTVKSLENEIEGSLDEARPHPARRGLLFAGTALALVVVAFYLLRAPQHEGLKTLAFLPLAYEGEPGQSDLKDLVPLLLGEELRALTDAEVVPYSSSQGFGPREDLRAVGQFLGVRYVVRGRLSTGSGRFHAAIVLEDVLAGKETWSNEWDGDAHDAIHGAEPIARALGLSLGLSPRKTAGLTASSRAYQSYLDGRRYLEGWDTGKNVERAVEAFAASAEADPSFAEAQAGLALSLAKLYSENRQAKTLVRGAKAAEKAASLKPTLPEGQLALGVVRLSEGRAADATSALERAQALAPQDDAICRSIAEAYDGLGRPEDAARMYAHAVALRPQFWENQNAVGVFHLHRGELDEAKAAFREVIRLRPEADTGYTNLAGVFITAGALMDAEPLLQAALRINPDWQAHNNLGFVYYATGRFEDAAREFRAGNELAPERIEPVGNLGDALRQLGRKELAQAAYGKAIALGEEQLRVNPSDVESRAGLAMFLAAAGRCPASKTHAATLDGPSKGPLGPAAEYYLVVAYTLCGDEKRAVGHAQLAIRGGAALDIRTNPDLRELRKEPQVKELLASSPTS